MSFISYAQNFEDVMLWRALKHVENGFYIDIGAQDPVIDSVSMAFYEHRWRGVHIEPTQQYSQKLQTARPDEAVHQVAIGNFVNSLTFFEFENTGLSTGDPEVAQTHIDSGFAYFKTVVPVISLDALFEQIGDREIHWLKLDVEGLEKSVLESWVAHKSRPWILVVESTKPLTQEQTHEEWEALLVQKHYRFAYFDGLNRFYVSTVHSELLPSFSSPPNIFDDFVLSGQASQPYYRLVEAKAQHAETQAQYASQRAASAEAQAQQAGVRAALAEAQAQQAEAHAQQLHHAMHTVVNSRSWRVTAPLRWFGLQARRLHEQGFLPRAKALIKKTARPLVGRCLAFFDARPGVKNQVVALAHRLGLYESMRFVYRGLSGSNHPMRATGYPYMPNQPNELSQLTPKAREIYAELKTALKNKPDSR